MFIFVYVRRTPPPCCSWVSVLRAALGCSKTWGQRLNTTSELLEQGTSRLRAYWRLLMTQTVRVSTHAQLERFTFVLVIAFCISDAQFCLPLLFSRRCSVALHPFSSMFLCSRPAAPAATLLSGQSCPTLHQSPRHPSSPAALLEHREPVCPPCAVLHVSSPPPPKHWGRNLPVDCRDRVVDLSQHRPDWGMYFKVLMKWKVRGGKVCTYCVD